MKSLIIKNAIVFLTCIFIISFIRNTPIREELEESKYLYSLIIITAPVIISRLPIMGTQKLMNVGIPLLSSVFTALAAYVLSRRNEYNKIPQINKRVDISKKQNIHMIFETKSMYIFGMSLIADLILQIAIQKVGYA